MFISSNAVIVYEIKNQNYFLTNIFINNFVDKMAGLVGIPA